MTRKTDTWIFNIHPDNWNQCVNGPEDATVHGDENVGAPVQAVSEAATAPINDLQQGDLALARIKGRGIAGIWEVREIVSLNDSQERNLWSDRPYSHIIYCDPLDRELDEVYEEDWPEFAKLLDSSIAGATGQIQGSITNLSSEYKDKYLSELQQRPLTEAAASRIIMGSDPNREQLEAANFWMIRAGEKGYLWEDWISTSPPVVTIGWDVGPPDEINLENDDWLQEATNRKHGGTTNSAAKQLQYFMGGRDTHVTPGDYVVVLGDASVEGIGRVGELKYQKEGLPNDGSHSYWREIEYLVRSTEPGAVDLGSLPVKFGQNSDQKHGDISLYDLSQTIQEYNTSPEELIELISFLADSDGMNVYDRAESIIDTSTTMPPQAILDWLDRLEAKADEYDISVSIRPNEKFQFVIDGEQQTIGKVRYSAAENRDYTDNADTQYIWQRFDRELEAIEADKERRVVAIQLDVHSKEEYDPERDNFLFLPQQILDEETSPEGNVKIGIKGPGEYVDPFNGRANHWQSLFEYASQTTITEKPTADSPTAPFYWVNHNTEEFNNGYLQAPIDNLATHDLQKLEAGDIVFNYFDGSLNGFSVVTEPATPQKVNSEDYWRVSIDTYEFTSPLPLTTLFEPLMEPDVRLDSYYPLNPAGINQQYLFNLSQAAGDYILHRSGAVADHYDILEDTVTSPLAPLLDEPSFTFELPAHLHYPDGDKARLKQEITAALNAGKHIILTGPPGTGKSDLATAIAGTASEQVEHIDDYQFTTATDSWTTFDTIGGYVPTKESGGEQLEFDPRLFLSCFRDSDSGAIKNEWLVIDELNRANIDDAFGQLFSVLSKDAVTLPYERDEQVKVEWVDNDTKAATQAEIIQSRDRYPVTPSWRLIGTMNTKDKASLYDLSFAFMRRFAFIHVPAPSLRDGDENVTSRHLDPSVGSNYATAWTGSSVSQGVVEDYYLDLSVIWAVVNDYRELGPAIIEDLLRHLDAYQGGDENAALTSAITTYIFPQLEGLRREKQEELLEDLGSEHDVINADDSIERHSIGITSDVLERQAADRFGLTNLSMTE